MIKEAQQEHDPGASRSYDPLEPRHFPARARANFSATFETMYAVPGIPAPNFVASSQTSGVIVPMTASAVADPTTAAAKLRRVTHRDLRYTFVSHLRLQGVQLEDIQELLGHSTISMVLRYAILMRRSTGRLRRPWRL